MKKALVLLREQLRLRNEYKGVSAMKPLIKETRDAIAELEEAMKPKNCEGCKHEEEKIKLFQYKCLPYPCRECARHATDRHEPKDQL